MMEKEVLAKFLKAIADQRITGLDVMNPFFTAAYDRLLAGYTGSLGERFLNPDFVDMILCEWGDKSLDCKTVFGYNRDEILDMLPREG